MSDFDFAASGVSVWAGGATIGDFGTSVGTGSEGRGSDGLCPGAGAVDPDGFSKVSGSTALGGEVSGADFVPPLGSRFSVSSAIAGDEGGCAGAGVSVVAGGLT
jgi:hypothetical protein